jgi:WD40 repeat protein
VYTLEGTANPHIFLSASGDGRVVRWDIRSTDKGEVIADAAQAVFALFHHIERKLLFIGNESGGLHVLDLAAGEEVRLLQAHKRGIFKLLLLPGERLACAAGDGSLSIWQVPSMELIRRIPLCEEKVRTLALSLDEKWLAVGAGDGKVRVLDSDQLNEHHTMDAHPNGVGCVAWHPTKPLLISGGRDGYLRSWNMNEGFIGVRSLPAHRANIYGIAFNNDNTLCATASRDKTVKIWDVRTIDFLDRMDLSKGGHTHSVNHVRWCADGTLLSASDDRTIRAWVP